MTKISLSTNGQRRYMRIARRRKADNKPDINTGG